MKVKFMFDSNSHEYREKIIEVDNYSTEEDIEAMFLSVLGVPYSKFDCRYKAINRRIFSEKEILSYTE